MSNDVSTLAGTWTILNTLQWTADYFGRKGIEAGRSVAELLLAHTLGCERIDLYLRYDQPLNIEELGRFKTLIKRRVQREPDAYIVGKKEFWSLSFRVTRDVLIPRPETECLVESMLRRYNKGENLDVLELGTGSGAISVALAHERSGWYIRASDISPGALEVAAFNADHLLKAHRIEFLQGSWFEALNQCAHGFDLIISNPPYIAENDLADLAPEIRQFEPLLALNGGPDGLECIRRIISGAPDYLKPGGLLVVEIGSDQASSVRALGRQCGRFKSVDIEKDYSGRDRVALFQ